MILDVLPIVPPDDQSKPTSLHLPFLKVLPKNRILTIAILVLLAIVSIVTPFLLRIQSNTESHASPIGVQAWLTTSDGKNNLTPQQSVTFSQGATSSPATITVDDTKPYQQMVGFGATITDTGSYLLGKSAKKDEIMQKLFDPNNGIGISFLREPIGATDFTPNGNYSLDDTPGDTSLSQFALNATYPLVPLIQQALQLNPDMRILSSTWSPPAWMKTNNALCNGYHCPSGHGTLNPQDYDVYARYLVKYIQAMQNSGIPIYAITPQNEPDQVTDYSGMDFAPSAEENFVQNYLLPQFKSNHLHPQIWIYDWNYNANPAIQNQEYANTIQAFKPLANVIDGTAIHAYQSPIPNVTQGIGDMYQDEAADGLGDWAGTPSNVFKGIDMMIGYLRNGAKLVTKWGIVEDQNNGPRYNNQGWCGNNCIPLITLNTTSDTYTFNHDYYSLGHLSKFVKPGANRIDSSDLSSSNMQNVAFKNPDGSKVLVVHNTNTTSQVFTVAWRGQSFTYVLPSQALVTFVWDSGSNPTLPDSLQTLSKQWYFAEGSNSPNQNVYFTVFNASHSLAHVTFNYYTTQGIITTTHNIQPLRPATIYATDEEKVGGNFATSISSDVPIAAERNEYFSYTGSNTTGTFTVSGANATIGVTAPSPTWYFSEGTTTDNSNEWLVLFNPTTQTATATLTYYVNGTTSVKSVSLPPQKPVSILVNDPSSGVGYGKTVSTVVSAKDSTGAPLGIIAERVMYFATSVGSTPISGGNATMGQPTLATAFNFPEGYTGSGTGEYLSLFNPGPATSATITYYTQCCGTNPKVASPTTKNKTISLPANARVMENVTTDVGTGLWVSTSITSQNPIAVERPMYFSYTNATGRASHGSVNEQMTGGHSLSGSVSPSTSILFPFGSTKTDWQQYLEIENPNSSDAHVQVLYLTAGGTEYSYPVTVGKSSRGTVFVSGPNNDAQLSHAGLGQNTDSGGVSIVLVSDIPIFAENTMYMIAPNRNFSSSSGPLTVASGYSVMGIPLAPSSIIPSVPTPVVSTPVVITTNPTPTSKPSISPTISLIASPSPTSIQSSPTPAATPELSSGVNPSINPTTSITPQPLVGDINKDGVVDILDYNILFGCYGLHVGQSSPTCVNPSVADLNGDGVVDGIDYNILLRAMNQ